MLKVEQKIAKAVWDVDLDEKWKIICKGVSPIIVSSD